MPNPLFNILGGQQVNPIMQLVQDARKLKQTFTGDPRKTVEQLVSSGQMSQEQIHHRLWSTYISKRQRIPRPPLRVSARGPFCSAGIPLRQAQKRVL